MKTVSSVIKATAKNITEIRVENSGKYTIELSLAYWVKIRTAEDKIAANAPMYNENMLVPTNSATKGRVSNKTDKNGFIFYNFF